MHQVTRVRRTKVLESWRASGNSIPRRCSPVHYVAVCICLLGVGAMVGADLLAGRDQGSTSNILLGDGLVLLSATLYAVSNVCQEYTVKNLSRVEFLGMVGLFGTVVSTVQMVILERSEVGALQWSWQVGLLFSAYALCMYALYSCMPIVIKLSSATSVNLSLLTADLFSLFCGIFLFQYNFSGLYLVSLVVVLIGFITFNAVPTPTQQAQHAAAFSSSSTCEEGCYDGPVVTHDNAGNESGATSITTEVEEEDDEEEQQEEGEKDGRWEEEDRRNDDEDAVGFSTKL